MTVPFDISRAMDITTTALLRELGDEVDLIFRYGSLIRGDTNRYSDLDISYVPRHDATWHHITVLVDEIMVDLYPIHWPDLEKMARFENVHSTILHDSALVYTRDEAVKARFLALRAELRRNQQPEARPAVLRTAMNLFQQTGYPYYLLRQKAQGGHTLAAMQQGQAILRDLLHIIAVINQAAVDTRKLEQIYALPKQPEGLAHDISAVMNSTDPEQMLSGIESLMARTRELLLAEQARLQRSDRSLAETLRDAYPELKGDIQHLILACEREDPYNFNLVSLLHELMIHMAWAVDGIDYSAFNSIDEYAQDLTTLGFPDLLVPLQARDYPALAAAARRFDQRLQAYLEENNIPLNTFASLDELQEWLTYPTIE